MYNWNIEDSVCLVYRLGKARKEENKKSQSGGACEKKKKKKKQGQFPFNLDFFLPFFACRVKGP